MVALARVLLLGILKGVLVAVVVSLLLLIRRAARPHVAFLGRIPGTRGSPTSSATRTTRPFPARSCSASRRRCSTSTSSTCARPSGRRSASASEPLRLVVCDLSTSPYVDLAGARMLATLHEELQNGGRPPAARRARTRRCATSCAPKDWRSASATSAAGSRWPISSTRYKAARERQLGGRARHPPSAMVMATRITPSTTMEIPTFTGDAPSSSECVARHEQHRDRNSVRDRSARVTSCMNDERDHHGKRRQEHQQKHADRAEPVVPWQTRAIRRSGSPAAADAAIRVPPAAAPRRRPAAAPRQ